MSFMSNFLLENGHGSIKSHYDFILFSKKQLYGSFAGDFEAFLQFYLFIDLKNVLFCCITVYFIADILTFYGILYNSYTKAWAFADPEKRPDAPPPPNSEEPP